MNLLKRKKTLLLQKLLLSFFGLYDENKIIVTVYAISSFEVIIIRFIIIDRKEERGENVKRSLWKHTHTHLMKSREETFLISMIAIYIIYTHIHDAKKEEKKY